MRIIFLFACVVSVLGGFAALLLGEHPTSSAVFGKGGSRQPCLDDIGSCGRFGPRTLLSSLIFIPSLVVFSTRPPPSRTKIIVSLAAPLCSPQELVPRMPPPQPPRPLISSAVTSRGTQPETRQEAPSCSQPSPAGSLLFLAAFCTAVKVKNSLSPGRDWFWNPASPWL